MCPDDDTRNDVSQHDWLSELSEQYRDPTGRDPHHCQILQEFIRVQESWGSHGLVVTRATNAL